VDLNGKSVKACTMVVGQADFADITTVEGLVNED
jgi:carbon-monoxide dehydrogenase small subunit